MGKKIEIFMNQTNQRLEGSEMTYVHFLELSKVTTCQLHQLVTCSQHVSKITSAKDLTRLIFIYMTYQRHFLSMAKPSETLAYNL